MAADLLLLEDCAHAVEIAVAAMTADTGPKPATLRNALLKAVIEQLPAAKMGEQKARELAVDYPRALRNRRPHGRTNASENSPFQGGLIGRDLSQIRPAG